MEDLDVLHYDSSVGVSLDNNNDTAVCPDGVLFGIQNPKGTKNMHDIKTLDCRKFVIKTPKGSDIPIKPFGTTYWVPLKFNGTGNPSTASCKGVSWAVGLQRGSNNNPNNAKLMCRNMGLGSNTLLVPGIKSSSNTLLGDKSKHGFCTYHRGVTGFNMHDKGSNLYDIKQFQCAKAGPSFQGALPDLYQDFVNMSAKQRKAECCRTDLSEDQKLACQMLDLRDGNMQGSCANIGDEWCKEAPAGDKACLQWCDAYPKECAGSIDPGDGGNGDNGNGGDGGFGDWEPPEPPPKETKEWSWKTIVIVLAVIAAVVSVLVAIKKKKTVTGAELAADVSMKVASVAATL